MDLVDALSLCRETSSTLNRFIFYSRNSSHVLGRARTCLDVHGRAWLALESRSYFRCCIIIYRRKSC